MIHSLLIVGGTKEKRKLEARDLMLEKKLETRSWKSSVQHPASSPASSIQPQASDTELRSSVDVTVLEPEEDKQTISIDQVRDLQHQLSLKPYAARFKTGIISEAQRMTIEAQNALLKTLEEPPAHSILILTAPSAKSLLPTTVSRCQIVRLRAEIDLDFESAEHQQQAEEFLQLLRSGRGERLAWAENNNKSLIANRESLIDTLDVWISVLRDLLLTNSGCQNLTLNTLDTLYTPKPQNPQNNSTTILQSMDDSTETLTNALERTIKTKGLIAKTNVSPRLALEVLLLDLPVLQPSQP